MRQRLFYKPPRKFPRMVWGAVIGFILVLVFLRAGFDPSTPNERWLTPLGLSLPAGAVGGYLFALLDPMRARGQAVFANILGAVIYLALIGAAYAAGVSGPH